MRRHARASSSGSSKRQGNGARRRLALVGAGALALLIALASTALALQTHAPGTDVEAPADGFGSLAGIATDPNSHQLYVADSGSNRIEGFSASGEFEGTGGWGVIASGPGNVPTNEHQSLTIDATGGTYVLSYEGEPSAAIAFDASAAELQSALEAIAQIGAGNVSVSGPAGGPYDVEFEGSKADTDVSELSADPTNLTGGAQSATVATTAQGADAPEICLIATGNTCKAGVPGNGVGQFNGPQDVTVNASGDFFVADTNNNRIAAFKANGEPLPTFGTEGLIDGTAAQPGSEDETPAPGFSSPCGLAIDDSNGNLFVADQNNNRIWIFDSTGAYKGKIADSSLSGPCGIAFDSSGDLYVRNANNGKVLRFDRKGAVDYELASTLYDPEAEPKEPGATDVAVDTNTDHVYVDKGDRITEYDSSGSPVSTFGQGQVNGSSAIAVDSTDAKLYASSGNRIATFGSLITVPDVSTGEATDVTDQTATLRGTVDPAGLDTTDCHFEYDTAPYAVGEPGHGTEVDCLSGDVIPAAGGAVEVAAPVTGLAPGTEYHFRLVSANAEGQNQGQDQSFTTAGAPTLPQLGTAPGTFVTEVSAKAATLNAELNPNGAATTYHFEYVDDAAFQASGFAGAKKTPDASLDAGAASIVVSQALSGLQPGTRYHYRIVASNLAGPLTGPEHTFKTNSPRAIEAGEFPGQGFLPDNRAWEMVSPVDKNGGGLRSFGPRTVVSPDGQRISYVATAAFAGAKGTGSVGDTQYISARGPDGWTTHAISPQTHPGVSQGFAGGQDKEVPSENVTSALIQAFDLPESTDDIEEGLTNLYRENADGSGLITLTSPPDPAKAMSPIGELSQANQPLGGDLDFNRIFFKSSQPLLPGLLPATPRVYEWNKGALRLAGILPDGSLPPNGSKSLFPVSGNEGSLNTNNLDTVSDDGSRVLFFAEPPGASSQLYMRRDHSDTVWISESEGSTPVADPQGVRGEMETPDLHTVAFTTDSQLTDDDPGGGGRALYLYTDSPNPDSEDNLKFIARVGDPTVMGIGSDGSQGYFASSSSNGLYHWDQLGVHEVLTVPLEGWDNLHIDSPNSTVRVSADGTRIAFITNRSNVEPGSGDNRRALYVYDSDADEVVCASCPPTGEPLTGETFIMPTAVADGGVSWTLKGGRFLTDDGRRVFFSTKDPLVPEDVNGRYDAYEYDVDSREAHLLSSGRSEQDSWFASASASGDDAFFITQEALSAHDVDHAKDMYDARVGGGLPEPRPAPPACEGDACQPPPVGLNDPTPASGSFVGQGNQRGRKGGRSRCLHGGHRVRAKSGKSRCVKKRHAHGRKGSK